jgi:hypothetical protein
VKNAILIGTYHKSGTRWMESVFISLAKLLSVSYYNISSWKISDIKQRKRFIKKVGITKEPCIIFDDHCRFDTRSFDRSWFKGIRMIRDPRDIIISGARYHSYSDEKWLHHAQKYLGGKTYQEALNDIPGQQDKLIFEMNHCAKYTIMRMLDFKENGLFVTVKYEDLITDYSLELWHDLCVWLGLTEDQLPLADAAFMENTIFGNSQVKKRDYIHNGTPCQYKEVFTKKTLFEFEFRFPAVLTYLGYPGQAEGCFFQYWLFKIKMYLYHLKKKLRNQYRLFYNVN